MMGHHYIGVEKIVPNPFQPRIRFDEIELDELADSIRQHGVMQPIVVRQNSGGYEPSGERRGEQAYVLA